MTTGGDAEILSWSLPQPRAKPSSYNGYPRLTHSFNSETPLSTKGQGRHVKKQKQNPNPKKPVPKRSLDITSILCGLLFDGKTWEENIRIH